MTLIYELELDIMKMYVQTKIDFVSQGFKKLEHERDRQTDRQTEATERITIRIRRW